MDRNFLTDKDEFNRLKNRLLKLRLLRDEDVEEYLELIHYINGDGENHIALYLLIHGMMDDSIQGNSHCMNTLDYILESYYVKKKDFI